MLDEPVATSPPLAQPVAALASKVPAPTSAVVPARVKLSDQQLETLSKDDFLNHWKQQDAYIETLLSQATNHEGRNHCGSVV